ncbi:MAG TPA: hypothetical protein VNW92_08050, partial [Polyangiaceae bacterium]|nr:hypothetical protein [Polyangiaceae bacterium]
MKRLAIASGTVLALALAVGMQACGNSDSAGGGTATNTGGSGNASSGGSGNATSAGGTVAMAGTVSIAGTGGSPTTGGSGGMATTVGGAGGSNPTGGASGSAPVAGGGGVTAMGGSGGSGAAPAPCDSTVAKAGACTTAGSVCSKTCGPDKVGYKTETCTAGAYAEGACTFPATGNYACYQKPMPLVACDGAPAAGPVASTACTATACMPCGPAY